ncbi:MAG TPA: CvpA family protein, partial [Ornithinibacter sp.]|nr:CvpA family protein [Ornithinibacter sp.]
MSGSVALDLTLLLLLALYAWSGWRQGFVSALLGLVGLVGGAVLAVRLVPGLLEDHLDVYPATPAGVLALVAAVVMAALLGQGLMLLLARRFRDVMTAPSLRAVDSGLGLV